MHHTEKPCAGDWAWVLFLSDKPFLEVIDLAFPGLS